MSNCFAAGNKFEAGNSLVLMKSYKLMLSKKYHDLKKYNECVEKSGGVTANLMDCSGNEIDIQDKQLNEYYKNITEILGEREKTELKSAQRIWIKDRDRACDKISAEDGGGTMSAVTYSECILFLTLKRKNEIEIFIKNKN
jgi:hypothetical protein